MTTDVNYNNNSNIDAPSSEDFNFKGFPYVISVLISEKFPITEENKDQFSGKLRNIISNINKLIGDNNTTLHILTNPNSNEFISENIVEENSNFCISVPNCNPNNKESLPTNEYIAEYIAQHSHLMIILGSGTIEEILHNDQDLKWTIQYKIEGYPGSNSQQGQAEKVTYPAVGPVLFIDNKQSYYFPSRNSITEEKAEVPPTHKRIFDETNIETHKTNSFDPSKQDEIYNNIKILKRINNIIKSEYDNKTKNKNSENYNNSDYLNIDSLSYKSEKINKTKIANGASPETPKEIQPLIKYYHVIYDCAENYKKWTRVSINIFCILLFLVLIFNAILIYLNDICITSKHTNAIQITQRYIYNTNPNYKWFIPLMEPLRFFIRNNTSTNVNAKTYITISSINISDDEQQLPCLFIFYLTLLYIDIIAILVIGILYIRKKPHYLYHRFQTLADCLRVQAYWKYAGMKDEVITNFRSHQIPEIDWLKIVLNGLKINIPQKLDNHNNERNNEDDKEIKHLDKCWLENRIKEEFEPSLQAGIFNNLLIFFLKFIILPFMFSIIPLLPFTLKHFIQYRNQIVDIIHYFTSLLSIIIYPLIKLLSFIINPLLSFVVTLLSFIINLKILLNPLFYVVLFLLILLLIYPYLSRIFRYLLQKVINKNILLIISLGFVIYFCFSGLFELIRLSSLCTNQSVDIANTSIDFMNVGELIRLIIQIFIAFVLIGFLYLKMYMFDKERKRMELLLPCFDVADRSIDFIVSEDYVKNKIANRKGKDISDVISNTMEEISEILLEELNNIPQEIKPEISENLNNLQSDLREKLRSLSIKDISIRNNNVINTNVIANVFNDDQINKIIDDISAELPREEIKDLTFDKESIDNDLNINELVNAYLSEEDINNIFDKLRTKSFISKLFSNNNNNIDESIKTVKESIDKIKKDVENHVNNVITNQINNINSQIAKLKYIIDKITEIKNSIKKKVTIVKTNLEENINKIGNDVNRQIDSFEENANDNFKNYVNKKIEDIDNTKAFSAEEFEKQIDIINELIIEEFKNRFNELKNKTIEKEVEKAKPKAKDEYLAHLLLELGQEVLAKRIDWLLDVNDRDLKSPK